jgi:TonB family protein
MAAGAQPSQWEGQTRRRVPRFELRTTLDVTVLRSGIPETLPGRALDVGERGIAAMLAGELMPDETVAIEVLLPLMSEPLRTRARVRYQDKLRCGLEFVGLSAEQQAAIRDCARETKTKVGMSPEPAAGKAEKKKRYAGPSRGGVESAGNGAQEESPKKRRGWGWAILILLVLAAVGAAVFWRKWNRGWEELESGLKSEQAAAAAEKPQAEVPAEVMEKLLIHRVEPLYPAEARRANLQGVIALDIVVGRDGSVVSMHALNGPDALVRAAMDALRWWKFEPYRLNGEPAVVETTVAVEFKR